MSENCRTRTTHSNKGLLGEIQNAERNLEWYKQEGDLVDVASAEAKLHRLQQRWERATSEEDKKRNLAVMENIC